MRPVDPRLLRAASAARTFLVITGALALVQTASIVAFAWFAGHAIGGVVEGRDARTIAPDLAWAALAVAVRSCCSWLDASSAGAAAARVRSQLRRAAIARLKAVPRGRSTADVATALGRGLDALDGYFGEFLPQLVRTAVATPIVVVALFLQDAFAGIAVAICLPLIPMFMALIGMATERVQRQQWSATQRLSRDFLATLEGLSTLKVFRRDRRAASRIRASSDEHRTRTMAVLRISFLSSFVLELAASLSVALVAVSVGIRLVEGDMAVGLAFSVLILVPEAFVPVRLVGSAFHASTEGLEASKAVLDLIDAGDDTQPSVAFGSSVDSGSTVASGDGLRLEHVQAKRGERALDPVSLAARPGDIVVIAGPSGAGKSSLIDALLGFAPATGSATLDGAPIGLDDIAWAPQGTWDAIVPGTVRENVALGSDASDAAIRTALERVGLELALDAHLEPATGGRMGLSGGQAQRLVLARALRKSASGARILIADEPTSALDEASEVVVVDALRAAAHAGAIVLVATHRPAVIAAADHVVHVGALA